MRNDIYISKYKVIVFIQETKSIVAEVQPDQPVPDSTGRPKRKRRPPIHVTLSDDSEDEKKLVLIMFDLNKYLLK